MSARPILKILCANGVNLDLLGRREPSIYGSESLAVIESRLREDIALWQKSFTRPIDLKCIQTNDESEYLHALSEQGVDGILLNPGAWTHTSLALADRLRGLGTPYVEVHLSNLSARAQSEPIRATSLCAPYALGVIYGLGVESYRAGLFALVAKLS
jgi:3-dehydroquinate dehydratase-2